MLLDIEGIIRAKFLRNKMLIVIYIHMYNTHILQELIDND